jgi:hypothetical protein
MLEMWQALATGLGTNTSSHSEQGQAIIVREIIDKSPWKYVVRFARMRSSTAVSGDSDRTRKEMKWTATMYFFAA